MKAMIGDKEVKAIALTNPVNTADATATPADVAAGKTFYGKNGKEVGAHEEPYEVVYFSGAERHSYYEGSNYPRLEYTVPLPFDWTNEDMENELLLFGSMWLSYPGYRMTFFMRKWLVIMNFLALLTRVSTC